MKIIKYLIALIICQGLASPVYAGTFGSSEKKPVSNKSTIKSGKTSKSTEECIVDKTTGQELCRTFVSSDIPTKAILDAQEFSQKISSLPPISNALITGVNGNRLALVIGNKDYARSPLDNPINDAQDMKSVLEQVGFRVIYRENADLTTMNDAVREFTQALNKSSVGLVYYSGHGAQADDANYLIPVGSDITSKAELKSRAYDAGIILSEMEGVGNPINIVILDACRNNPFKGSKGGAEGLTTMSGPRGSLIAYATAPGSVAADGASGRNGIYTSYLKQYIAQPGLKIEEMFKKVREAVIKKNPDQIPWENSSMTGDFCFSGCNVTPDQKLQNPIDSPTDNTIDIFKSATNHSLDIEMVSIPKLKISIGKFEITQKQWKSVMGKNPSKFSSCGDNCPVEMVSWEDVDSFMKKISKINGKNYRLPTEDEWYTVCQAEPGFLSNKYCGSDDITLVAWHEDNSGARTHPVGQKMANAWGVYDMSGNVWEWTQGCFEDDCSLHTYRGGAWNVNFPADVKSAYRSWNAPANRLSSSIGFRVVLDQ